MQTMVIIIKLRASWVQSLKEKRTLVKSLIAKLKNKFNLSVAEVDLQDTHKVIVLGLSYVTTDSSHADSVLHNIMNFIDINTEAEIIDVQYDMIYFSME